MSEYYLESKRQERRPSALVVDDYETNRRVLAAILEPTGASVTFAVNGRDAVESFLTSRFDLIFMDIEMPVLNGLTALKVIRQLEADGGLVRTPIFIVSAFCSPRDVLASLNAGADAHFEKPLKVSALRAAILEVFGSIPNRLATVVARQIMGG